MALGALIGAYQEDDNGGLRALLPLSGRTLIEYQVRCAATAGAAPIVIVVERVPQALQDAFERLRLDGIGIFPASDPQESVSRFEAGSMILLIGDGVAAPATLVTRLAEEAVPAVATVPDDEEHAQFERIDAQSRWAGVAIIESRVLGSTAAILGDWDLQSTLLRRTLQEGAERLPAIDYGAEPVLAEDPGQLDEFEHRLFAASRAERPDAASRFVLPWVEELASRELLATSVRPGWLIWSAIALTLAGVVCFTRGWLGAGLILLLISTPLDLIASRLAILRLRPLPSRMPSRSALEISAAAALLALGWWESQHFAVWGAVLAAVVTIAFAEASRIERGSAFGELGTWLFGRRNAIFAAIPFAAVGRWTAFLLAMMIYAGASFFVVQQARHRAEVDA
jgi:MobA-like NTP transferase domain